MATLAVERPMIPSPPGLPIVGPIRYVGHDLLRTIGTLTFVRHVAAFLIGPDIVANMSRLSRTNVLVAADMTRFMLNSIAPQKKEGTAA